MTLKVAEGHIHELIITRILSYVVCDIWIMTVVFNVGRYRERGNIEAQFFIIQTKLKSNGQHTFVPKEGKMLHDIETGWTLLEKSEHNRELALREELIRLVSVLCPPGACVVGK